GRDRKLFVDFVENQEIKASELSVESILIDHESLLENKSKISDALSKISKRQREIVVLKYFNDLSYSEIASLMSISPASAQNLLSKALQCLRVVLKMFFLSVCLNFFK